MAVELDGRLHLWDLQTTQCIVQIQIPAIPNADGKPKTKLLYSAASNYCRGLPLDRRPRHQDLFAQKVLNESVEMAQPDHA